MPMYQVTQSIDAAPETIWPVLADVMRWADWTPTVSRVDGLDGTKLSVGARFKVFQPKLRPATWTITALDSPRSFTWESRSPGMLMVAEHILSEHGPAATTLDLRFTFRGILGAIAGRLAGDMTQHYISTEASKLKARVEGSRQSVV